MRIELKQEQIALLGEVSAPYNPELDYNDDALIELEEYITDYVLNNALDHNQNITPFGEQLLLIHADIVRRYDS